MFFTGLSIKWKLSQAEMFPVKQNSMRKLFFTLLNSHFGWTEGITTVLCFEAHVAQAVYAENQCTKVL